MPRTDHRGKHIRIRTWEGLIRALRAGRQEYCLALMGGGLRASHAFELVDGKIEDWSMVDGSVTKYTRAQFQSRFGPFMKRGQLWAE